jgi:hypothetical protein
METVALVAELPTTFAVNASPDELLMLALAPARL